MNRLSATDFDFGREFAPPLDARWREEAERERLAKARGLIALLLASVPQEYRWVAQTSAADFSTVLATTAPHVMPCLAQVLGVPSTAAMILLTGRSGTGKSVSATARARLLAENGERVLFVQALDLGAESRATE